MPDHLAGRLAGDHHAPVDAVRIQEKGPGQNGGPPPAKECPKCRGLIATAYRICPQCGFQFPEPEKSSHEASASDEGILSGQVIDREMEVRDVIYSVHTKKDADESAPKTFRVDYRLGLDHWASEWICFEHQGWPRRKAEQWWKQRCPDPVPDSAEEAVEVAERGRLAATEFVTVRSVVGEKFDRIIGYKLGPLPPACSLFEELDWEEVPF
jgi:DNA repair protein RadD